MNGRRLGPALIAIGLVAVAGGITLAAAAIWSNDDPQPLPNAGSSSPSARAPLTATEAEAIAVRSVRGNPVAQTWLDKRYTPFCNAIEREGDAWLVVCGMEGSICLPTRGALMTG
jgi:hypothetical protein